MIELLEICGDFLRFTDLVSARTLHNIDELSESDLDKLFIEAYQSAANFVDMHLRFSEKGVELYRLCVDPIEGKEKLASLESKLKIEKVVIPFIGSAAFDIKI